MDVMKPRTWLVAALACAVGLFGILSSGALANPAVVIKMKDFPPSYIPSKVTIKVGDEVEWDNTGNAIHTVTASPPLPAGAQAFDSGPMMPGAKFTHKFTVPGTYHYICVPHANSGMVGDVIVTK